MFHQPVRHRPDLRHLEPSRSGGSDPNATGHPIGIDTILRTQQNSQTLKTWTKALFLLPVAFVAIGGGFLSLCHLFQLVGLDPHHHGSGCIHFCEQDHSGEERTPCDSDCLLKMPDADTPQKLDRVMPPALLEKWIPRDAGLVWEEGKDVNITVFCPYIGQRNRGRIVPSPQRTGRFLI